MTHKRPRSEKERGLFSFALTIFLPSETKKTKGESIPFHFVREFAPPYEVSAGDGGAMLRTHSTKCAKRIRAVFDERAEHKQKETDTHKECLSSWCIPRPRYFALRGDASNPNSIAERSLQTLPRAASKYGNLLFVGRTRRMTQDTRKARMRIPLLRNLALRGDVVPPK